MACRAWARRFELMPSSIALLVFDFDGVVADTEIVSNGVLADALSEIGLPTTLDDALRTYMGRGWKDCAALIEQALGRPVPPDFAAQRQQRIFDRLATELRAVDGVVGFIEGFREIPRCVASSSSPEWLRFCLERLGLAADFGEHVYSVMHVARGKPHPDVFLHAAKEMGVHPDSVVVLEDSPTGVRAGIAAGMTTIGICAGSHVRAGHRARLDDAGAHHVVDTFDEAANVIRRLMS